MTPKEFLRQYSDAEKSIRIKMAKIQQLRELAVKVTQAFGEIPVQSSSQDAKSKIMDSVIDEEKEIAKAVQGKIETGRLVRKKIESLESEKLRRVLECRYINDWAWAKTAEELDYDIRHVIRLHGEALEKFKEII